MRSVLALTAGGLLGVCALPPLNLWTNPSAPGFESTGVEPREADHSQRWSCLPEPAEVRFVVSRNGEPVPGVRIGLVRRRPHFDKWTGDVTWPDHPFDEDAAPSPSGWIVRSPGWADEPFAAELSAPTDAEGVVRAQPIPGVDWRPVVRDGDRCLPLAKQPVLNIAHGRKRSVDLEVLPERRVTGRCFGPTEDVLRGIVVQAFDAARDRPVSLAVTADDDGRFELLVPESRHRIELRAWESLGDPPRPIEENPRDTRPVLGTTVVSVPGADSRPVQIQLRAVPSVVLELTGPVASEPFHHVQVEQLEFDEAVGAWRRVGGPSFLGRSGRPDAGRSFVAIPRSLAEQPFLLWSYGRSLTVADARGMDHVTVEIPEGRRIAVKGERWRRGDKLRVICHVGPPGRERPCIWTESGARRRGSWSRNDAPPVALEVELIRDGRFIARSERIPPSTEAAEPVRLDAPE